MSRPRSASLEARLKIHALEKELEATKEEVEDLKKFKERIELGSKWLYCAFYTIGGIIGSIYVLIQIIKSLNIKFG